MSGDVGRERACERSRTVLITGASGGIGTELVRVFRDAGWNVIATDSQDLDVTNDASVAAMARAVDAPDVLINNAGLGILGPMAELPDELLARQFDVNVRGLARVTRAFAPAMCERGAGRIINVSSLVGVFTLPWFGAYAASKHAVEAISDALRLELKPFNVDVVVVEPSVVGTGFVTSAVQSLERASERSLWAGALRTTLARRSLVDRVQLTPAEVANAVFKAATAARPRPRYRVGFLASWLIRLSNLLPTRARDAVLRSMCGLTPSNASPLPRLTPHSPS